MHTWRNQLQFIQKLSHKLTGSSKLTCKFQAHHSSTPLNFTSSKKDRHKVYSAQWSMLVSYFICRNQMDTNPFFFEWLQKMSLTKIKTGRQATLFSAPWNFETNSWVYCYVEAHCSNPMCLWQLSNTIWERNRSKINLHFLVTKSLWYYLCLEHIGLSVTAS